MGDRKEGARRGGGESGTGRGRGGAGSAKVARGGV